MTILSLRWNCSPFWFKYTWCGILHCHIRGRISWAWLKILLVLTTLYNFPGCWKSSIGNMPSWQLSEVSRNFPMTWKRRSYSLRARGCALHAKDPISNPRRAEGLLRFHFGKKLWNAQITPVFKTSKARPALLYSVSPWQDQRVEDGKDSFYSP